MEVSAEGVAGKLYFDVTDALAHRARARAARARRFTRIDEQQRGQATRSSASAKLAVLTSAERLLWLVRHSL
jgi:hypothetical protein